MSSAGRAEIFSLESLARGGSSSCSAVRRKRDQYLIVKDLLLHVCGIMKRREVLEDRELRVFLGETVMHLSQRQLGDSLETRVHEAAMQILELVTSEGTIDQNIRRNLLKRTDTTPIPEKVQSENFFGLAEWNRYFGSIGNEPPLMPSGISDLLKSPCPFFPGKRIEETHALVFVPSLVNGRPLTLNSLGALVENPLNGGNASRYEFFWEEAKKQQGEVPVPSAHWILMTKGVIPNTQGKDLDAKIAMVKAYQGYEVPKPIHAAVAIFMGYTKSGTRWYPREPFTYTLCHDKPDGLQLAIGAFADTGLIIRNYYGSDSKYCGVGAVRRI